MKKRIISLFLVMLLLVALSACDKQKTSVLEYGVFYSENSLRQNTRVYLSIDEEAFLSPLKSFSYKICNETSFSVKFNGYRKIEYYQDGIWQELPPSNNSSALVNKGYAPLEAGGERVLTETLHEHGTGDRLYDYEYLSEGLYRIVFSAYFDEVEGYPAQDLAFYIVGYFEVHWQPVNGG